MASQFNLSINEVDHQQAMMGIWCKKCFHKCAYEEKVKHKTLMHYNRLSQLHAPLPLHRWVMKKNNIHV